MFYKMEIVLNLVMLDTIQPLLMVLLLVLHVHPAVTLVKLALMWLSVSAALQVLAYLITLVSIPVE